MNLMNETVPGAITIRAFNYQKKYQSMYHERQDENLKLRLILNGTAQWNDLYLDFRQRRRRQQPAQAPGIRAHQARACCIF